MGINRGMTAAVLLLALTACGESSGEDAESTSELEQVDQSAEAAEEAEREQARQQRRHDRCADAVLDLSDSLDELDSRLAIGLTNDEYGDYVGDARVEYDKLVDGPGLQEVSQPCVRKVAIPLENALQDHIDVYNDWSDCIQDFSCDFNTGEINDRTQAAWVRASERVDNSDEALSGMQP